MLFTLVIVLVLKDLQIKVILETLNYQDRMNYFERKRWKESCFVTQKNNARS
jgi:hypothetical protein